jgi:putative heme transporter
VTSGDTPQFGHATTSGRYRGRMNPPGEQTSVAPPDAGAATASRDASGVVDAAVVPHGTQIKSERTHERRDRWLTWLRRVVAVVVLAFVVVAALTHKKDLDQAVEQLNDLSWGWLGIAIAFEAASLIAFARLQRWLLRAAGVHLRLREMVEITLAGNALAMSLPGGAAWAAAWDYAQLYRRGARREVAVWVVLVAGALSSFVLFLLMVIGSLIAGSGGPVADFRPVGLALLAIPVAVALVAFAAHRSQRVRDALHWIGETVSSLPGGRPVRDATVRLVDRMRVVRPSPTTWLEALGFAALNWLEACACLAACIIAVHGHVPWRGLLVAYTVGQVAASLPITPGGIGIVEGSITGLLVAYGMPTHTALASVLLFRIVSFWALVPIGWIAWATITLASRRRPSRFQHPWRVHPGADRAAGAPAQAVGATRPFPDRVFPPPPCVGCEGDQPDGEHADAHHEVDVSDTKPRRSKRDAHSPR